MVSNKLYLLCLVIIACLCTSSYCLKSQIKTIKMMKTITKQGGGTDSNKKPRMASCTYFYECQSAKCYSGLCL